MFLKVRYCAIVHGDIYIYAEVHISLAASPSVGRVRVQVCKMLLVWHKYDKYL